MLGAILGALGGIGGKLLDMDAAKDQQDMQVKFAKKGIQWKVADATAAGLHPLAALGANTMSYSPIQVGGTAELMANMGQDVGRSIQATQNGTERAAGALGALQLERAGLENDLLRTQIASENSRLAAQIGPPMPTDGGAGQSIPGQGNSLKMGGMTIKTDPGTSNSQDFENRYGEPAEWLASPGIAWNDLKYNASKMTLAQILKWIDTKTRMNVSQPKYWPRKNSGYPRFGGN